MKRAGDIVENGVDMKKKNETIVEPPCKGDSEKPTGNNKQNVGGDEPSSVAAAAAESTATQATGADINTAPSHDESQKESDDNTDSVVSDEETQESSE